MKPPRLASLFAVALLLACSSLPQQRAPGEALRRDLQTIFVARRGWHVDIGFRTEDILPPLASISSAFPGARYVFFGFGDRHYLLAAHKNFPGLFAALWPGAGLVLTTALVQAPAEAFGTEHVIALQIDAAAAQYAQEFVWRSLQQHDGAPIFYASGPYNGSQYLSAVPKYSATHTCTTWAAEVLQAAGLPVTSRGVLFARQLWSQTRRIEAATRVSAPTPQVRR